MLWTKFQLLVMSHVIATPPSLPIITWFEFAGSIQIACTSSWIVWVAFSVTVLPPSTDLCSLTPAYRIVSVSLGSIRTWLKYIGRAFSLLTFLQVAPASSDRYSPV